MEAGKLTIYTAKPCIKLTMLWKFAYKYVFLQQIKNLGRTTFTTFDERSANGAMSVVVQVALNIYSFKMYFSNL